MKERRKNRRSGRSSDQTAS